MTILAKSCLEMYFILNGPLLWENWMKILIPWYHQLLEKNISRELCEYYIKLKLFQNSRIELIQILSTLLVTYEDTLGSTDISVLKIVKLLNQQFTKDNVRLLTTSWLRVSVWTAPVMNRQWCHGLFLSLMVASYFLEDFQDEALIEATYMLSLMLVPLCRWHFHNLVPQVRKTTA